MIIREKRTKRKMRKKEILEGTKTRPRMVVFRSNKYIYAQLVNDDEGKTLLGISEKDLAKEVKGSKTERAKLVGEKIAKVAIDKKIKEIVFDRSGYKYHGRVKALAEGARSKGLKF